MKIELHNHIEAIADRWAALDRTARREIAEGRLAYIDYSFYQTLEWNRFLAEAYRGSKVRRLDYIVVSDDRATVAIVPLLANRLSKKIEIVTGKIAGIINAACPYGGARADEAMKATVSYMAERYRGWKWKFYDMPVDSPLFRQLKQSGVYASERGSFHIRLSAAASHDDYVGSLGKNIYKNIRKAYNHLATDGKQWEVRFHDLSTPPSAELRRRVWTLYFERKLAWKKQKSTPLKRLVCAARGYLEATRGMRSLSMDRLPQSELVTLEIDGRLAAFMHIYVDGEHVVMPKLAIEASFSRYSPGIVMLLESLRRLRERGVTDFDMCRGDERYKREMGGENQPLGGIYIKNATPQLWNK